MPHNKLIEEKVIKTFQEICFQEICAAFESERSGDISKVDVGQRVRAALSNLLATRDAQMIEAVEEEVPEFSGKSDYSVGWNDARKRVLMFLRPKQQEEVSN